MLKRILILAVLLLMTYPINSMTLEQELTAALIESTIQLEEAKNTIQLLNTQTKDYQSQVTDYQNQVKDYQSQVTDYQNQVKIYPTLFQELRIEFQETTSSLIELKTITNEIISHNKTQNTRLKFLTYSSAGGLLGIIVATPFDQQMSGLGIGIGSGMIVFIIDYIIDRWF